VRVRYDDVTVRSMPAAPLPDGADGGALARQVFGPDRVVVPQRMANDKYMLAWSTERIDWLPWSFSGAQAARQHVGLFAGDVVLRLPALPAQGTLTLAPVRADGATSLLELTPDRLRLLRGTQELAAAPRPADNARALVWTCRADGRHEVRLQDELLMQTERARPAAGALRLTLSAPSAVPRPSILPTVTSAAVHDYTFYTAPVDWRVASGTWEVTSRWICTPDWSWFGGVGDQSAVIWSKNRFAGDQVVDLYAAVMMSYGVQLAGLPFGYRRRGDINLSFCADGRTLSSGYTVMFGGFDNTRTCLWRGDRIVAERSDRLYPIPKSGALHKSWFNVRAARLGNQIRVFLNDEPILNYDDPEPLTGGHVALWTWDSGVMVPRVRVFAERSDPPATPFTARPGVRHGAIQLAEPVPRRPRATVFANPQSGGDISASLGLAPFNAREQGVLQFAYRLPPSWRGHLYLRANGRDFYVAMNAPEQPLQHRIVEPVAMVGATVNKAALTGESRVPIRIGSVAITADNRWHSATIDLAALLVPWHAHAARIEVRDVALANWCNTDYLMCGFGGNPADMVWAIDRVRTSAAAAHLRTPQTPPVASSGLLATGSWRADGETPVRLLLEIAGAAPVLDIGVGPKGGRVVLVAAPIDTVAHPVLRFDYRLDAPCRPMLAVLRGGHWQTSALPPLVADGAWHSRQLPLPRPAAGDAPIAEAVALQIPADMAQVSRQLQLRAVELPKTAMAADATPPAATAMHPADGDAIDAEVVAVTLRDAGSGIDCASLQLTINDDTIGLADGRTHFDPRTGVFSVHLTEPPADGTQMQITVAAADRAGNALPPTRWRWTMRYAEDTEPPPAPYVAYLPSAPLVLQTFEQDVGEWRSRRGGWARRTQLQPATGSWACQSGGFSVFARYTPFDARQWPLVRVDYRLTPGATCNWVFLVNNKNFELRFNSPQRKAAVIGALNGVVADGAWHRAEFDLTKVFASQLVPGEPLIIGHVAFYNRDREGRWFDNFSIAARSERQPRFEWSALTDPTGIAGYSVVLDQRSGTVPSAQVTTTATSWRAEEPLAPGTYWLHVRGRDGAGNWGSAGHAKAVVADE
jgi:hypothetical protein